MDDSFDMAGSAAKLEALGALQTKASATKKAAKAAKAVDGRALRSRGRTSQVNVKVTRAEADMIRAKAHKLGLGVSEYVLRLVMGDKQ